MKTLWRLRLARLGLFMLLFLSGMAPLHLIEEVHALLPASAEHHAEIHCAHESNCEQLGGNVSQPLTQKQHEQHHQSKCCHAPNDINANAIDVVKVAPTHWNLWALEFVPVSVSLCLQVPDGDLRGRAPPTSEAFPLQPSHSSCSGRAPPVLA